jgi:predicted  nucleic acid-binding Zn-ribbon protein
MSHEPPAGWIERRVRAAMQSETDALRSGLADVQAQMAELRTMIQAVWEDIAARAARTEAGFGALHETVAGDERFEALRLRVEGLVAQHRWDSDQLRQSLAAIAERLPLAD